MNYETIPAQIRCTKCRTIQDATHKFCKECGINFTNGKIPRSIFEQAEDLRQKEWNEGIDKWREMEKRYFIPPITCVSTSPEASRVMAREFFTKCDCKSHIPVDMFSQMKFEDIVSKD